MVLILVLNLLCALVILVQMALELWQSRPKGWSLPAVMRLSVRLMLAGGAIGVLIAPFYGFPHAHGAETSINLAVAVVCVARFVRMSHLLAGHCPVKWMPGGLSCASKDLP